VGSTRKGNRTNVVDQHHQNTKRNKKIRMAIEAAYGAYSDTFVMDAPELHNDKGDDCPTYIFHAYPPGLPTTKEAEHISFNTFVDHELGWPHLLDESEWPAILDNMALKFKKRFLSRMGRHAQPIRKAG